MRQQVNLFKLIVILILTCQTGQAVYALTPLEVRAGFAQALDQQDVDAMLSYFTEDSIFDISYIPEPMDKAGIRAYFEDLYLGSPDAHTTEGQVFNTGNIVVVEHALVGTKTGDQPGIPATGAPWVGPHLDIYEIEGDKIKQLTTYADIASYFIQNGLAPMPEIPPLVPAIDMPAAEATGLSPMEANAELVRRWGTHDAVSVAKMYHTDLMAFAGPLGMELDRDALTAVNEMYFTAFPDVELDTVRRIDLGGGWVVVELLNRGTHTGPYMGIPIMGFPISIKNAWLTHFDDDGLLTYLSFYYDNMTLTTQITTAPYPLDGIWVSSIPTPLGNILLTTQYVAQDAEKTKYSGSLGEVNPIPALLMEIYPDVDPIPTWAGGHAEAVGRDQYHATFLGYLRKNVVTDYGPLVEVIGLVTIDAHFELTGPDSLKGQGMGSYYLASQDANQDGFPDEGEEPVACVPWQWTGKKLGILPGCIPPIVEP